MAQAPILALATSDPPPAVIRKRIAFLAQYLSIGGIETRLLKILRAIDRERFEPWLICARDDGLQAPAFKALGVPILVTSGLLAINRTFQAIEVARVLRAARVRRFDAVVSFLGTSQPFEVYLARFGCRPRGFLYALVNRDRMGVEPYWTMRKALAARIVAVSRGTALAYYPPSDPAWDKLRVIPNGVDLDGYRPRPKARAAARQAFGLPADDLLFVYSARVAPGKGHEALLEVATRIAASAPGAHFVIAGQDKRDGWLQAEVARRGLGASVTYLGAVHDMPRLLAACDGVLLLSPREGCPNALLEGMACGLPAIVTHSGAEEFVVEGETGFSVPVDDVDALTDRVLRLVNDPEWRTGMGRNARGWMERHGSNEVMLAAWFEEFEALGGRR